MAKMQSPDFQLDPRLKTSPPASSRILDIPCKVCGDYSSGKHYNIFACDGCAGFFKRSIRRNRQYVCKAKEEGTCVVNKLQRNQCRACRLAKCQEAGMNKDAVQHERGPRNSTLRRQQMATHLFNESREVTLLSSGISALDSAMAKQGTVPPAVAPFFSLLPPYLCNAVATPRIPCELSVPVPISSSINSAAAICESAARLLFINVTWAKSVPSLKTLSTSDQLLLLEESWRELFILSASQCLVPIELTTLVQTSGALKRDLDQNAAYLQEVKEFQETLTQLNQFHIDAQEFACLRAIVLFKTDFEKPSCSTSSISNPTPSESRGLHDIAAVTLVQDHTQLTLNKYISAAYPEQPLRFGKLMMLLPKLRFISSETIENLFFRKTIGNIPIERIICDMYKSSASDI